MVAFTKLFDTIKRHWLLLAALVLYGALAAPQLELPGLHYDEALEAAAPAALLLNGQSFAIVNNGALQWRGLRLPLMVQNHIGAVQVYAAMPFVALLGPTTVALRTMTVLVGAATLVAMYMFVAQVYGHTAAGAAALWLAAFPSFVFWSRQGVFVTNLAPCFAACAFASGARWWRMRSVAMAIATGLLAGLAVWSKLSALWLVNGALAWGILIALATWRTRRTTTDDRQPITDNQRWQLLAALGGFFLGILPIILYNLLTGFATFRAVGGSAATTYLGTSNLAVLANLATRFGQFADVLASGAHLWYLGGPFPNWWALASVLVALAVIGCALMLRRGRGWRYKLFPPFLALACIAQSCFTISALWPTHFAIAVWLPPVIVGVAVGMLGGERRTMDDGRWTMDGDWPRAAVGGRWSVVGGRLAWLGLVLVVASQAWTSRAYLDAERVTGGFAFHSTAIADVSRFLATRPEPVVALDWGIAAPIEYLTNGTKRVEEFYGFTPAVPPDFAAALRQRFGRGELYVLHAQYQEAFQRRQAFLDAVKAAGLRAETVNVSIRKDGWPMIEVWRVVKPV